MHLRRFLPGCLIGGSLFLLAVWGSTGLESIPVFVASLIVIPGILVVAFRRPSPGSTRGYNWSILVVALLGSCAALHHRDDTTKLEAERVVAALKAHKERTGRYPDTLEEAVPDAKAVRSKLHLAYSPPVGAEAHPMLFFSSRAVFLAAYHYSFASGTWTSAD